MLGFHSRWSGESQSKQSSNPFRHERPLTYNFCLAFITCIYPVSAAGNVNFSFSGRFLFLPFGPTLRFFCSGNRALTKQLDLHIFLEKTVKSSLTQSSRDFFRFVEKFITFFNNKSRVFCYALLTPLLWFMLFFRMPKHKNPSNCEHRHGMWVYQHSATIFSSRLFHSGKRLRKMLIGGLHAIHTWSDDLCRRVSGSGCETRADGILNLSLRHWKPSPRPFNSLICHFVLLFGNSAFPRWICLDGKTIFEEATKTPRDIFSS